MIESLSHAGQLADTFAKGKRMLDEDDQHQRRLLVWCTTPVAEALIADGVDASRLYFPKPAAPLTFAVAGTAA